MEVPNEDEIRRRTKDELRRLIHELQPKVEAEVPETGEMGLVWVSFPHPDAKSALTDVMLNTYRYENEGEERTVLELRCYSLPLPYVGSRVIESGTKTDILAKLQEQGLADALYEMTQAFAHMMEEELGDACWSERTS